MDASRATVPVLFAGLTAHFHFYNDERRHQSLGYHTPASVFGDLAMTETS